jgi:hypothetical protein
MKADYQILDELNKQLTELRTKVINKIVYLLKELGGEVYINDDELQEYNIYPYISCQGEDSLINKIYLDENIVRVEFCDYTNNFRLTENSYDEILSVFEMLLCIKENNIPYHSDIF